MVPWEETKLFQKSQIHIFDTKHLRIRHMLPPKTWSFGDEFYNGAEAYDGFVGHIVGHVNSKQLSQILI